MYRRYLLLAVIVVGCRTETNARYCDSTTPCATAAYPYCDLVKNECQAGAPPEMDAAMAMDLSAAVVDMATPDLQVVIDAAIDAAMPDQAQFRCAVPTDCPSAAAPICDTTLGDCRPCEGHKDDPACVTRSSATPFCRLAKSGGPAIGSCVQCNSNLDCPQTLAPFCDTTGTCRLCAQHSDCTSLVCIVETGLCADSNDVAYIDNTGDTISNCRKKTGVHDGAPAHPYCDIIDGINAGKPFERVTGHLGSPYSPLAFNSSASFTIVGPGAGGASPATIGDNNVTDVAVSLSGGNNVTLVLDGVELGDRTQTSNNQGLFCAVSGGAGASVTLRNDTVQRANNTGISSSGCTLVVSATTITNNANNGLAVNGGTVTVSGSTIVNNAGSGVDCAGNGNVTLTGCSVGNNNKGVNSNSATVILDSNRIFGSSTGGGAHGVDAENNSVFTLINNFIYGNSGVGVKMSGNSSGKFIFNTVVENAAAGVDCGSGAAVKPLEASIVWGNLATAGTQFPNTTCELLTTVTGPDNFSKAIQLTPAFVSPSPVPGPIDLHLKVNTAANNSCCVDKVGGQLDGGSPLPDHDVDSEARPKGLGYDVGADEAQ